MIPKTLTVGINNLTIVGDIHINTNLSEEFEATRLEALAKQLNVGAVEDSTLVLAGDTFDKNVPSLEEIRLFYMFIASIKKTTNIIVINGNHDLTTFEYLPAERFIHISTPTVLNEKFMLVPYDHIHDLAVHLELTSYRELTLISHARCTIPPYITEEVSIKAFSEGFKQVILGDIHTQPSLPFNNVIYTTSPSNVHFTKEVKDSHGFLRYSDGNLEYKPIKIPSRFLVEPKTAEEVLKILKAKAPTDLLKIRYEGTSEELRELSKYHNKNIIKDLTVKGVKIEEGTNAEVDSLTEFLSAKASLTEFAFRFFKESLGIQEDSLEELRQAYERKRTAKGSHK